MNNINNDVITRDQNGKPFSRFMIVAIMLIGGFFTMLNETVLATAFPKLMSYFSVNASTIQWLTSAFLMTNGIVIPLSAWLTTRINTKWLYQTAMILFLIGTCVAYVSTSFGELLVARIIQAIATGISFPLFQTIMLRIFPASHRGAALGLAGLVVGLSPAIGPTLSGWIIDNYTWRDLFGINIIPLAIVTLLGFYFLKPLLPTRKSSLDFWSLILSCFGFGLILYGFSSVGNDGWGSLTVIASLVVGIIIAALFVWRDTSVDDPLLNLKVFRSYKFDLGTLIGSLAMMSMVGFEMVLPLYLQTMHGDSALESGLTLLPGALMLGIFAPVTGQIFDKFGARNLSISGFLLLTIGTVPFIFITKDTATMTVILLYAIRNIGIALSMMTIMTFSMNSLSDEMITDGTSATNTVRQIAASIATAILTSVLTNVTKDAKPGHSLLATNPLKYKNDFINAGMSGYHWAFIVSIIFCILGLISAFLLHQHDLGFTGKRGDQA